MTLVGLGAMLLLMGAATEQWKVRTPAPGLAKHTGHIVVVLRGGDIPSSAEAGAQQLDSRGIKILRRPAGAKQAYLVDEAGIVRRQAAIPSTTAELLNFVSEWKAGRSIFRNRCARCHGEDGMEKGYPLIAQLGGIGERRTRSEIRDKLAPSGTQTHSILVRGDQYSEQDFEALVTFLAGL